MTTVTPFAGHGQRAIGGCEGLLGLVGEQACLAKVPVERNRRSSWSARPFIDVA
jgi:hypothetical protein